MEETAGVELVLAQDETVSMELWFLGVELEKTFRQKYFDPK